MRTEQPNIQLVASGRLEIADFLLDYYQADSVEIVKDPHFGDYYEVRKDDNLMTFGSLPGGLFRDEHGVLMFISARNSSRINSMVS